MAPGPTPFGIKVVSSEDPHGSAVEEGVITVGRFADRTVELYPLTARGRRKGRFEVAVDNRGNAPIEVEFGGSDPENACRYDFAEPTLVVEPGTAHFGKFEVVPHKRFWKGPPKTHQFQVLVSEVARHAPLPAPAMAGVIATPVPAPDSAAVGPPPETVNGSLLQEALLPPWLLKAVLAALALLLVLWILWLTLFKPTIQSAAKDAVAGPLDSLAKRVDEVAPTTTAAGSAGGVTPTTVPGGSNGGVTPTTVGSAGSGQFETIFGNPADFQLGIASAVAPGSSQAFDHAFTAEFSVTDIVIQNPAGDAGLVQIARDGNVLLTSALENFRDHDLHYVSPFVFKSGQKLTMTVTCTTPAPTSVSGCAASASFNGFSK